MASATALVRAEGPEGKESVRFVPGYPDAPIPRGMNLAKSASDGN